MKVLIVDDEELIRNVIKEYCLLDNYEVIEASNGLEAIDKVKENNDIDIIILDVMMPKLDGFSAFKKIREIKSIPTIILSARNEEFDKLIGFDLGIDDYVTKPFSPKELMARIKAVLKRSLNTDNFVYSDLVIDYLGHTVKIDGKEVGEKTKEIVSYMQEKNIIPKWMKVKDIIEFYRDFYKDFDNEEMERLLKFRNLNKEMKSNNLSKGMCEKLA